MSPIARLTETGDSYHLDPTAERSIPPFDPTRREHFWSVILVYRWDPDNRRNVLGGDALCQMSPPGCYYCEQPYCPALRDTPCPGEPDDHDHHHEHL